jgi:hypothetical protein
MKGLSLSDYETRTDFRFLSPQLHPKLVSLAQAYSQIRLFF